MCSNALLVDYLTLSVSGISTVCILTKYNLIYCSYFVGVFCIFDLYYVVKIKKIDIIIHHLLVITLIYFLFSSKIDDSQKLPIVETVLSTEISTNFLILKNILPGITSLPSSVVHINNFNSAPANDTTFYFQTLSYLSTTSPYYQYNTGAWALRNNSVAKTAIKIYTNTYNIATGVASLYGISS